MIAPLIVSRRSLASIASIAEYISRNNPRAAERMLNRIYRKFQMLRRQPMIGEPRDDLRDGLRSVIVRPYVVLYEFKNGEVSVLDVVHAARDMEGMSF